MVKYWLPVFLCMVFIFLASSLPGTGIPSVFEFQDIFFHLVVYAVLGVCFSRAIKFTFTPLHPRGVTGFINITPNKIILFTILFAFAYGSLDEFHQVFVPYRSVSAFDVLTDTLGGFIGSLFYGKDRGI